MHLSTLHPHADVALVARALNENAPLKSRSFAILETAGSEAPCRMVLEADPRDRGLRLVANGGLGAEVTVRVPEGDGTRDYVGKLTHLHEVGALRGAVASSLAPILWTGLAATGIVTGIPALGGDLGVVALSLVATFEGVRRLTGYFKRLTGSDVASAVVASATASSRRDAEVQSVQVAPPTASTSAPRAALPAPVAPELVIPPLSARDLPLVAKR